MTITLRSVKGSALSHGELDENFQDLAARIPVVTPEQHGAVGDGATSDTTALDSAIAAAVSTGRVLRGDPSKTYYVGASLADFTGTLRISDLHFKAPNQVRILRGNPTWAAENTSLTGLSTVEIDGTNVTRVALTSTPGLAVGDWVMVGSNTVRWPVSSQVFWFETAQIVALVANTSIDLHRRLLGEETGQLDTGLRLFKIPNYRLEADRIRFSVDGDPFTTAQTGRLAAIELRGGIGHQINNLSADTWWDRLLITRCAVLSQIRGVHWNQLPDITDPSNEALGYGYEDGAAGYGNSVVGMNGGRCRHGYTNGGFDIASYSASTPWEYGIPANGHCSDSLVAGHSNAAFDTHEESLGTTFSNCVAVDPVVQPNSNAGNPAGFQDRGYRTRHSGCSARGGDFGFRNNNGMVDWTSLGTNVTTYENCSGNELDQAGIIFQGVNAATRILINGLTVHGAAYALLSGTTFPFAGTLEANGVMTADLSGGIYFDGGHTGTVSINQAGGGNALDPVEDAGNYSEIPDPGTNPAFAVTSTFNEHRFFTGAQNHIVEFPAGLSTDPAAYGKFTISPVTPSVGTLKIRAATGVSINGQAGDGSTIIWTVPNHGTVEWQVRAANTIELTGHIAAANVDASKNRISNYRNRKYGALSGAQTLSAANFDAGSKLVHTGAAATYTLPSRLAAGDTTATEELKIRNGGSGAITLTASGVTKVGDTGTLAAGETAVLEWEHDGSTERVEVRITA